MAKGDGAGGKVASPGSKTELNEQERALIANELLSSRSSPSWNWSAVPTAEPEHSPAEVVNGRLVCSTGCL